MCFIMSDLKCYGSGTQAVEIMFEMKRKKSNEKIIIRKVSFSIYKLFFFSFLLFGPLLLSKLLTFSFLVHFTWFKML